jgi:DNA-binding transcriptional MerR regulator
LPVNISPTIKQKQRIFVVPFMNAFTIKDLENLSGIKAHTIRIWEQRYSFLSPQRTETNIRYYSNEELQTILNIALLNKYGYKISHINKMSAAEISRKILELDQAEARQERLVNELIKAMVEIKMDIFEMHIENYIRQNGIEKAIIRIIFPFLERIGILWLTNHINPAQEHLVSNLIRQKLIVGIDHVKPALQRNITALLFLPENEHHELGLLFICYLLKSHGIQVLYLGANVPLRDVISVANLKNPDFLYTHLTSVANHFSFEKFLTNVHDLMPNRKLVLSGVLTVAYKKPIPANCSFKQSLSAVMEYVSSL